MIHEASRSEVLLLFEVFFKVCNFEQCSNVSFFQTEKKKQKKVWKVHIEYFGLKLFTFSRLRTAFFLPN